MRRVRFYKLFDAVLLLLLMSVGAIATWVFLDEKGGLFLNVALFTGPQYTESVDGKQRKGFYLVSYSNEPCLEMVIFLYVSSVLL